MTFYEYCEKRARTCKELAEEEKHVGNMGSSGRFETRARCWELFMQEIPLEMAKCEIPYGLFD
jgi:hypothetical protein